MKSCANIGVYASGYREVPRWPRERDLIARLTDLRLGDRWAPRSALGPVLAGSGMRLHPWLAGVLALTAPSGASPSGYDPQTGGQDWDADVMGSS